jgi:hypothetical protein
MGQYGTIAEMARAAEVYTLRPTPYTLHPISYTLNLTYTPNLYP